MGGAEMYTSNKISFLQIAGWSTSVYYTNECNTVMIENLFQYKSNCIKECRKSFIHYSKREIDSIIERILPQTDSFLYEELVIESQTYNWMFWGELIASKLNAKHILNCLEERLPDRNAAIVNFLEYKLKKMEILNAVEKSLKRYFGAFYMEKYCNYSHDYMRAYCSNVVSDVPLKIKFVSSNHNILSIGRLDKPYIMSMVDEIIYFCNKNQNRAFNVFFVGGSPDGNVELLINNRFASVPNATIYLLGYIYPIPTKLLDQMDVCIATANSILVSYNRGIPTIAIDNNDDCAMGIYGVTTSNRFCRQDEEKIRVSSLLYDCLITCKYPKNKQVIDDSKEFMQVFQRQLDFLSLSSDETGYYDIYSIYSVYDRILARIKQIIYSYVIRK